MTVTNSIHFLSPDFIAWMQRVSTQAEVISASESTSIEFRFTSDTTYFFESTDAGAIRVGLSSRGMPAAFFADFATLDFAERYLAMVVAGSIRRKLRLGQLRERREAYAVSPAARVRRGDPLIDSSGQILGTEVVELSGRVVARFPSESVGRTSLAAGASWFLQYTVPQIITANLDPFGKPFFNLRSVED